MNRELIDDPKNWHFVLILGRVIAAAGLAVSGVPIHAAAGTFLGNHGFDAWGIGYDDLIRIDEEVSPTLQPTVTDFCSGSSPVGLELNYDGKTSGLSQPYTPDLDFDLPVDVFERSTTITFGPALFNMALPFLSFNEATTTYTFHDSWGIASGTALLSDADIDLTDDDRMLQGSPFDPASLVPESLYDLDGAPVNVNKWGAPSVSQMLSAVVMGYDLGEVEDVLFLPWISRRNPGIARSGWRESWRCWPWPGLRCSSLWRSTATNSISIANAVTNFTNFTSCGAVDLT
jgi:hypothetical protein